MINSQVSFKQSYLGILFSHTDYVTLNVIFQHLMLVMRVSCKKQTIRSTWLCYLLVLFLMTAFNCWQLLSILSHFPVLLVLRFYLRLVSCGCRLRSISAQVQSLILFSGIMLSIRMFFFIFWNPVRFQNKIVGWDRVQHQICFAGTTVLGEAKLTRQN